MRELRIWPDPILNVPTNPVTDFGPDLKLLAADMLQIMHKYKGVGLAAPQIGVRKSIIVYDCDGEENVLVNPVCTPVDDAKLESIGEGCLSFPGVHVKIERPNLVNIKWQTLDGDEEEDEFYGFLAIAVQHEIDHLEGKTLVSYLSQLKRDWVRRKMSKLKRKKVLWERQLKKMGRLDELQASNKG